MAKTITNRGKMSSGNKRGNTERHKGKEPQKAKQAKESKKKSVGVPVGAQIPLLDTGPKNIKKIAPHVRVYKAAMKQRVESLAVEIREKGLILALALEANLIPLPNGHITFTCEGIDIDIEPRDFVIHTTTHKEKKKAGRPKKK